MARLDHPVVMPVDLFPVNRCCFSRRCLNSHFAPEGVTQVAGLSPGSLITPWVCWLPTSSSSSNLGEDLRSSGSNTVQSLTSLHGLLI